MLTLALTLACAPTATPVRFFGENVTAGPSTASVIVDFTLWDAAEQLTTASGVLSVEVKRVGEREVLCRGQRDVARSDFEGPEYRVRVEVPWDTLCPGMGRDEKRVLIPRFVPSGGTEVETWSKNAWKGLFVPLDEPPEPPPPELPPPTFSTIAPWPLAVDALGTQRQVGWPDARVAPSEYQPGDYVYADPQDPESVLLETPGCTVRFVHPSSLVIRTSGVRAVRTAWDGSIPVDGAMSRHLLAKIGAVFSVDGVGKERWRLHYTRPASKTVSYYALTYTIAASTKRSILYGLAVDGQVYLCRGDYDTAEQEACGAAICAQMRPG